MESTLALTYADLTSAVGLFLGHGRGADGGDRAWSGLEEAVITGSVKSGLRQFYYPALPDGSTYDWSFLKPTGERTLASGETLILLPDDFGGLGGEQVVVSEPSSPDYAMIPVTNEGKIRQSFAQAPERTGRPEMVCLQPIKGVTHQHGQRFQFYFFPIADQDYTVQFSYYVLPDALSDSRPYAYGGMAHAETILESCLAIAEERQDDDSSVHAAKYRERLAASIAFDRRLKPQQLGYNRDRSDWTGPDRSQWRHYRDQSTITLGGSSF